MKKMNTIALITLLSMNATASDIRDAVLRSSTKATESVFEAAESTIEETLKVADFSAEELREFINKNFASSVDASGKIGEAIVKLSEVSEPVFQLTGEGIAMVFEGVATASEGSSKVSEKLTILLEPTSEVSEDVLEELLVLISKGSEASSEVSEKIFDILEKPLEATGKAIESLNEALVSASEGSTEISESVLGEDNLEAAVELTGEGISLSSGAIFGAFYFVTRATEGIFNFFEANSAELEKAVERNDQVLLAGARDVIRSIIEEEIVGGKTLARLMSDKDLDLYIQLRTSL